MGLSVTTGLQLVRDAQPGLLCRPRLHAKLPPQQRARAPRLAARSSISHRTLMAVGAVAEARLVVVEVAVVVQVEQGVCCPAGLLKTSLLASAARALLVETSTGPLVNMKVCPRINHLKEPPMPSHRAVGHIERPIIP